MKNRAARALILLSLLMLPPAAVAQEAAGPVRGAETVESFDTSYSPSAAVNYRVQRAFLDEVYRRAGADTRADFQRQFDQRTPTQIWQELVEPSGLSAGNVADALASYWILNWTVANGAFETDVPAAPVREQLSLALGTDASFRELDDDQRQAMAERLMLDYIAMHLAVSRSLETGNTEALQALARQAVISFRQQYGVDLLALQPGAEGLTPRR